MIAYEYCTNCAETWGISSTYCLDSFPYIAFGMLEYETTNVEEESFPCFACGNTVLRHPDFLNALNKRNYDFVNSKVSAIEILGDEARELLMFGMLNFSVPSFVFSVTEEKQPILDELMLAGFVDTIQMQGSNTIQVILDVYKLGIFDREDILSKMSTQMHLYQSPDYYKKNKQAKSRKHSKLRKTRMDALPYAYNSEIKYKILNHFEGKCAFTGRNDVDLQIDHVLPVKIGSGGTVIENLLPIWQRINASKGDRNVFEWYKNIGERFGVCPERFSNAISYIAELNGMSYDEYESYVYACYTKNSEGTI